MKFDTFLKILLKICEKPSDVHYFDWDELYQGYVLGAYFVGYLMTSAPAGLIASFLGASNVIIVSSLISGILNALTPIAADLSVFAVIFIRGFMGLMGVKSKFRFLQFLCWIF